MNATANKERPETAAPAIELRGISKAFGPVQANKDISIRVMPGTIHGIIGENGAGKSTLMSILYGFYKADAGEIFINGNKTEIPDSQAAIASGIGMVPALQTGSKLYGVRKRRSRRRGWGHAAPDLGQGARFPHRNRTRI